MSSSAVFCLLVAVCLGPTAAYINKVLENDSVCSMNFLTNNLDLLGREEESAMVIKSSHYFDEWTGKQEFNCHFTVTSQFELGVFAVIQQMYFRRNSQDQCIDYVQFRRAEKKIQVFGEFAVKIKPSDKWGKKICGNVNMSDIDGYGYNNSNKEDNNIAVWNSFIDAKGTIDVKIHIADVPLELGEKLNFEIVFTSYQECHHDNGIWKSCGSKTCIYKEFFHDGILNCPFKTCKDENSCRPLIAINGDRFNTTFGTKVLAGTIAGLFTMFVAFIAFLWLFRHCGTVFCCMGHPNSHPHSSEMQPVPHLDTMAVTATAPPEAIVASGTDLRNTDKDLPPSYDSLFPSK